MKGNKMNIGMVVFSMSGNTLSVAEKLSARLIDNGHEASIIRLEVIPENAKPGDQVSLKDVPDISGFDAYVFASPVMAFRLPAVSREFLSEMSADAGKQAACFVTEQLPFPWMGGNNAIRAMKKLCAQKELRVLNTGIINWSRKDRPDRIDALVDNLAVSFGV
jgi:hypothetical protein